MQAPELFASSNSIGFIAKLKFKSHNDFGANIFLAQNADRTAHHIDNIFRDGHAKACSLNTAYRRRIHTGKRRKNLLQEIFTHADTIILHKELVNSITRFSRNLLDIH